MTKGRSVRLYLAEGSATGLLTAEIVNWTGHALAGPRTRLEAALRRDELARTGVYLLYSSPSDGTGIPTVYVGEGDDLATRLRNHSRDEAKEFWERFVAITSKDLNLTKAHVRYLEARLIELLAAAKKCRLHNRTAPEFKRLPEADIADMETFLDELQLLLPVIGVDFLRRPIVAQPLSVAGGAAVEAAPHFTLKHPGKGIAAEAVEADGEFVVLAGSTGSLNDTAPSFRGGIRSLREQALETGRAVRLDDNCFRLVEDTGFSSPSAAAVFLFGTNRNGRSDWLIKGSGLSYGAWKDMQIAGVPGAEAPST